MSPELISAVCNCCEWTGEAFAIARGADQRDLDCPGCGSRSRHRLLHFYLQMETQLLEQPTTMLHFAPERALRQLLSSISGLVRVTTDRNRDQVDVKADICRLPFRDALFDLIMLNHVMEHIPDDRAAHAELFRVSAPGGLTILTFPYHLSQNITDEDASVTDPAERKRRWGREDHFRSAGADYPDRLQAAGFHVGVDHYATSFTDTERLRFGLLENVAIFRCEKATAVQGR